MSDVPVNHVTWFQIPADDADRAWGFYGAVFGWSEDATRRDEKLRGGIRGEITDRTAALAAPRLVIRVDDLDASLGRIVAEGGALVSPPTEVPGIGMAFAAFRDPEGNILNLVSQA